MFARAKMRQQRRNELWRSARLACPTYEAFRASAGAIERAVASQMNLGADKMTTGEVVAESC